MKCEKVGREQNIFRAQKLMKESNPSEARTLWNAREFFRSLKNSFGEIYCEFPWKSYGTRTVRLMSFQFSAINTNSSRRIIISESISRKIIAARYIMTPLRFPEQSPVWGKIDGFSSPLSYGEIRRRGLPWNG